MHRFVFFLKHLETWFRSIIHVHWRSHIKCIFARIVFFFCWHALKLFHHSGEFAVRASINWRHSVKGDFLPDSVSTRWRQSCYLFKEFRKLKAILFNRVHKSVVSNIIETDPDLQICFCLFFCFFLRKVYSTCNSVFATTDSETGICCMVHDETVIRSQRIHKSLTLCCVRFIRLYVSHYSAIRGLFFPAALNSLTGKHFAMQTSNSSIITFLNSKHFSKFITSAS